MSKAAPATKGLPTSVRKGKAKGKRALDLGTADVHVPRAVGSLRRPRKGLSMRIPSGRRD